MEASAPTGAPPSMGGFRGDLLAMARRDRVLYAIALGTLLCGFAMQPVTGNQPDWAIVVRLTGRLSLIGGWFVAMLAAYRLAWLAVVARSRRPTRELLRWAVSFCRGEGFAANAVHTVLIFFVFAGGFSVLKGAIAIVAPFSWDPALAELDRVLHFGRYPHEWLQPLLASPLIVYLVNFAYNLWFLVLVSGYIACACATRRQALRHQYLMSFMMVWFVGGLLVATAFSSAGPCFYGRLGLGDLYEPLMTQLQAVNASYPIWALEGQNGLWEGFTGERPGSAGIAALPSLHVATATLFALAARRLDRRLFAVSVGYWALIMLGSVLLGWHYAVDGYAGTLIAVLAWWLCGLYSRRAIPAAPDLAGARA